MTFELDGVSCDPGSTYQVEWVLTIAEPPDVCKDKHGAPCTSSDRVYTPPSPFKAYPNPTGPTWTPAIPASYGGRALITARITGTDCVDAGPVQASFWIMGANQSNAQTIAVLNSKNAPWFASQELNEESGGRQFCDDVHVGVDSCTSARTGMYTWGFPDGIGTGQVERGPWGGYWGDSNSSHTPFAEDGQNVQPYWDYSANVEDAVAIMNIFFNKALAYLYGSGSKGGQVGSMCASLNGTHVPGYSTCVTPNTNHILAYKSDDIPCEHGAFAFGSVTSYFEYSGEPQADPYEQIVDAIAIAMYNGRAGSDVISWDQLHKKWIVKEPDYLKDVCNTPRLQ
jgi:hypothetical protein